jgi:hypothetical protein
LPATSIAASEAIRLHLRKAVLDLVVFAVIGKRLVAGPFGAKHIQEFIGAGVALVLVVEGIAILPELGGIATGDDVERNPPFRKLVDGRELAGDQRRRSEARPLGDHDMKPIGDAEYVLADLQTIRRGGMKRQKRAVEAGDFMGLRHRLDVAAIQHRA